MNRFIGFLFLIFISAEANAIEFKTTCEKLPHRLVGGFCVHVPTANASNDVVYYLHGSGNNEFTWEERWYYTAQLKNEWGNLTVPVPTVISFSFGPIWLLVEKNASAASGLYETFVERVLPMIEAKIGGVKGRRMIFGESMGGFNTLQLALKTNLFAKAAVLCSPMSEISPFASGKEIETFVKSSSAYQYYKESDPSLVLNSVKSIVKLIKIFYPMSDAERKAEWLKADPMLLANSANFVTKLYVAIGFYDRFAAYDGNEKFVSILKTKQANVDWRPQWGGHCAIDIQSLAKFLTE